MKKIVSILVLSSFALGACATTPYKVANIEKNLPQLNAPQSFEHTLKVGDYMTPTNWWTAFNDPTLDRLIAKLLEKNPDMAEAGLRLEKSRLNAELTGLDAKPIYNGSVGANENIDKDGNNSESFSISTGVSYQLDLWGKLRAAQDVAKWEVTATEGDLQATRLTLIGSAINYYWQIAYLHEQIRDANSTIDYARKILEIVRTQYKNGAVSGIELAQAEQSLHSQVASLAALEQTLVETRNSLAILLDGEKWGEEATKIPDFKYSEIAPGIPAQILARRPDMRAAELRLKQSLGDVEIARLKMYPDISLTGSLGSSSDELIKVLNNPILALGAGVTLPFLNVRQNELNTDIARKNYEIAVVEYRKTFLAALYDVDNALSNGQKLKIQAERYALNLDAAKRAETRYKARYKEGAEALRVWLDAQEKLRTAQLQYDNARLSQLINRATLYQALGGDGAAPFADKN
jgi:NodT family efflux transporter outer membrane factor (OMF) lipoprotein